MVKKPSPDYDERTINTATAWNISRRRHSLVFNGIHKDLSLVSKRCVEDARLWAYLYHKSTTSMSLLKFWCNRYDPP
jgi:hypothetical protein